MEENGPTYNLVSLYQSSDQQVVSIGEQGDPKYVYYFTDKYSMFTTAFGPTNLSSLVAPLARERRSRSHFRDLVIALLKEHTNTSNWYQVHYDLYIRSII